MTDENLHINPGMYVMNVRAIGCCFLLSLGLSLHAADNPIPGPAYVGSSDPGGDQFFRVNGNGRFATVGQSLGNDLVIGNTSSYATGMRIYNAHYRANNYWLIGNDSLGGLSFNQNGSDLVWMGRGGTTDMIFNGGKAFFPNALLGVGVVNPTARISIADAGNQTLRVGITDNRSNAVVQILESLSVTARSKSGESGVVAGDVDYYGNGVGTTWAGTLIKYYGTARSDTLYGVPNAGSGMLLGQNVSRLNIAVNGVSPINMINATGVCLTVAGSGNIGIGVENPTSRLAVKGTISASEVRVMANPADYVFADDYVLRPLNVVEAHIKEKRHLPGVPSAQEQMQSGSVAISEMQRLHLEKIEELTLYAIEADRRADAMAKQVQLLEQRLMRLEAGLGQQK